MDRINTSNKAVDLFGPGKHGFKPGNPVTAELATFCSALFLNGLQEETVRIIEAAGLTPSTEDLGQLLKALRLLAPASLLDVRVYSTAGAYTYTPPAGLAYALVEVCGGGGGGGGTPGTGASPFQDTPAGGGAAGTTGVSKFTAAEIGASIGITVGAGGAGGIAGVNNGAAGGVTAFGSLLYSPGGLGGNSLASGPDFLIVSGGAPGADATGANLWTTKGEAGGNGIGLNISSSFYAVSGKGGSSSRGAGARGVGANNAGVAGQMGSGGSGAHSYISSPGYAGGKGGDGFVIIAEYGVGF